MAGAIEVTVELVRYFCIWLHKVDRMFVNELIEQTSSSISPLSQTSVNQSQNQPEPGCRIEELS